MAVAGGKSTQFKLSQSPRGINETELDVMWQQLRSAIDQIFAENSSKLSFEELYRIGYTLVLHKQGPMLYKGITATIEVHMQGVAAHVSVTHDTNLLAVLFEAWEKQKKFLRSISDVLMYLDRNYVQHFNKRSVYDVGILYFRDFVIRHANVRSRMRELLLNNIALERNGEVIDTALMRGVLCMLFDVGLGSAAVYVDEFETEFLATSRNFYTKEALEFLSRSTCPEYLIKVERRIAEERTRLRTYIPGTVETAQRLRSVVNAILIEDKAETLVHMEGSGAVFMMQQDRLSDLQRMFRLFNNVPSTLKVLLTAMKELATKDGKDLVTDQERAKMPIEFVQKLLSTREKYISMIDTAFMGHKGFHKTLKEAFEHFMNLDARCAMFLALYVDEMMKHGFKGQSDQDVDLALEKVVILFRYLYDKDVFETYYKTHLQKRLLGNRSLSNDIERIMITKLKSECGFQFTSKFEGMFADLNVSKDTMVQYNKLRTSSKASDVELDVVVLTAGFWPANSIPPCILPPHVAAACEPFKSFYLRKHTGRRLTWQTNQGTADVRTLFTSRPYELTVSTYQMCILLQFNTASEVSFRTLQETTNIPVDELKRHVLSLTTPKLRILNKSKKGKEIEVDESFRVNEEFSSKLVKIKVPLVSMRSAVPESAEVAAAVPEPVEEDRRHAVEAVIVRIMKTRKTLDHANLVAEVAKLLVSRFQASPASIKKRIESLIEREYLERSEDDRRTYRYIA